MNRLPIAKLLGLALALRCFAVCFSRGYEFVDQQFQYVDPAWGLATGCQWWKTWEWIEGIRSWAYPGMLAGVFRAGLGLGIDDPQVLMVFVRGVHALVSLVPIFALWNLVAKWRPQPHPGRVVLLTAASFVLVYSGVQPSGLTFAVGLTVAAVLCFDGPGLWPLWSGVLLGLGFACRFQDALLGPVLFVAGLVQRRSRASILLTAGALFPVLGQGLLDVATWGSFLHSAFAYVRTNVIEGKSAEFGTSSVLEYFVALAVVFVPFVPEAWRVFRAGARALPVATVCAVAYIALHALIARKQARFILPALALLQIVWIVGAMRTVPVGTLAKAYRRTVYSLHVLALVWFSFHYYHRGPIQAALALRADPTYEGRLLLVDTGGEGIGGAYWLGRSRLELERLGARKDLAKYLAQRNGAWPLHVILNPTENGPLRPEEVGSGFTVTEIARTADWPDLRARDRRHALVVSPVAAPESLPARKG